mgnify:CR=1 FL=1
MKKVVRIGKVGDQDAWRREDVKRMSPNERVSMVLEMQDRLLSAKSKPLTTQIRVRRHGGNLK